MQGSSHTLRVPDRGRVRPQRARPGRPRGRRAADHRRRHGGREAAEAARLCQRDHRPRGPAGAAHPRRLRGRRATPALEPGGKTDLTLEVKDAAGRPGRGRRARGGRRGRGRARPHRLQDPRSAGGLLREARARGRAIITCARTSCSAGRRTCPPRRRRRCSRRSATSARRRGRRRGVGRHAPARRAPAGGRCDAEAATEAGAPPPSPCAPTSTRSRCSRRRCAPTPADAPPSR